MIPLANDRTTHNPLLQSRVLLRGPMEHGFEPPDVFEEDILLKGRVHQLFSAAGEGKTMVGLWVVAQALLRGQVALYFDNENGPRIVTERLLSLGVDPATVDDLLVYVPSASMSLRAEDRRNYEDLLDGVRPDLLVYDSWVNFLAAADLDENSNSDVARWAVAYSQPARSRGITVVILDHVPWDGKRSRGASRKKDEMDVCWRLENTQRFDRDSVGEVVLHREKDRLGFLPPTVTLSIGGTEDGFLCQRSAGTVPQEARPGLTAKHQKALMVLRTDFMESGAGFNEWQRKANISPETLSTAIRRLRERGMIQQRDGLYFAHSLETEEVGHA